MWKLVFLAQLVDLQPEGLDSDADTGLRRWALS